MLGEFSHAADFFLGTARYAAETSVEGETAVLAKIQKEGVLREEAAAFRS